MEITGAREKGSGVEAGIVCYVVKLGGDSERKAFMQKRDRI